ncbi:carcinine hydrolase/isopenicillin-N N-acyltransferase family protein [Flammeovirgaceae bacterium SG7u.111]|nr:carcinine hydrolase/isopenicillin-N N-acyltransferase family protein [Flammeovirgaceae bacterium SG7u.132]WPO37250.1 carcinine hydrolase/isopenicillin-N N-acyltransferase family protein [Flammeovirgaceae bacterium SG7u.111]
MRTLLFLIFLIGTFSSSFACSVVYYVDKETGKVYVANNEDYWYDVKAFIQLEPRRGKELARLWYGWDGFAQGGVNEAGLFFDGAVTPEQEDVETKGMKGNMGDQLLAGCRTVEEALKFLDENGVALSNAHMMLGDKAGNAVVVEWVRGKRELHWLADNKLVMTNFLLSDTTQGNYPCPRYASIQENIDLLEQKEEAATLLSVGNVLGRAAQPPKPDADGKVGGTLYSSFINLSDMEFVMVYKLDNQKVTKLDLATEFANTKRQKIKLR